jgi:hypothetical protein
LLGSSKIATSSVPSHGSSPQQHGRPQHTCARIASTRPHFHPPRPPPHAHHSRNNPSSVRAPPIHSAPSPSLPRTASAPPPVGGRLRNEWGANAAEPTTTPSSHRTYLRHVHLPVQRRAAHHAAQRRHHVHLRARAPRASRARRAHRAHHDGSSAAHRRHLRHMRVPRVVVVHRAVVVVAHLRSGNHLQRRANKPRTNIRRAAPLNAGSRVWMPKSNRQTTAAV